MRMTIANERGNDIQIDDKLSIPNSNGQPANHHSMRPHFDDIYKLDDIDNILNITYCDSLLHNLEFTAESGQEKGDFKEQ